MRVWAAVLAENNFNVSPCAEEPRAGIACGESKDNFVRYGRDVCSWVIAMDVLWSAVSLG